MEKLSAAFLLLVTCLYARADDARPPPTGNDLIAACNISPNDIQYCESLFFIVIKKAIEEDSALPTRLICLPQRGSVKQLVAVSQKALSTMQEHWHMPASTLVYSALWAAFPCKK